MVFFAIDSAVFVLSENHLVVAFSFLMLPLEEPFFMVLKFHRLRLLISTFVGD